MNYGIRITSPYDTLTKTVETIAKHSENVIVYEHTDASRTHIHMYVEGLTVSTDTVKNWVKKELNITPFPKSDWAFETKITKGLKKGQPVDRSAIVYFHKGKFPVMYNKGFTQEFIEEQHGKSFKKEVKTIEEKKKEKKKINHWDIIEEVRSLIPRNPLGVCDDNGDVLWIGALNVIGERMTVPETAYKILIEVLEKHKIRTAEYELRRWLDSILRCSSSFDNVRRSILSRY